MSRPPKRSEERQGMAQDQRNLDQRFADAMGGLLGPSFPSDIGLAVSGGGDSMAMLYLAHNWAHRWGVRLWVVTVNHGLRPEAAEEAAMVAAEASDLGWPHAALQWRWDGQGNKMDAARRGRLALIDRWRGGLRHVLMAHTRDDVAETFLMRMARGSGVEGLSAMAASREVWPEDEAAALGPGWMAGEAPPGASDAGFQLCRPCLEMGRAELRHYLTVLKGRWVDDPSNDDEAYGRVRMRKALPELAALGLDVEVLTETATRMARAREALEARARMVWREVGRLDVVQTGAGGVPTGSIVFERDGFERVERDTQLRLLAAALQYVSGAGYRPRVAPLEAVLERALSGGGGTLHGCELRMERGALVVFREYQAVRGAVARGAALWDGRWQMTEAGLALAGEGAGLEVRALGDEGWRQAADLRRGEEACGPGYAQARSLPALWRGERLVACDALGIGARGATLRLLPGGRAAPENAPDWPFGSDRPAGGRADQAG